MHVITVVNADGVLRLEHSFVDRDRAYAAYDKAIATDGSDMDGWLVTMADDGKVTRRHLIVEVAHVEPSETLPAADDFRERAAGKTDDGTGDPPIPEPAANRKATPRKSKR